MKRWNPICRVIVILLSVFSSSDLHSQSGESNAGVKAKSPSSLEAWNRVSDEQGWQRLPEISEGKKGRLPHWCKAVALQMPRTAAAMLELDAAQRTQGPLDPVLRAKLRWVIANTNKCEYTKAVALCDLRLAGVTFENEFTNSLADPNRWPSSEKDACQFVEKLTTDAPSIPDALFERLQERYGDHGVSAIVVLAAYGNFQDRLCLGLQVPVEAGGPLPPVQVKFAENSLQRTPVLPQNNGQAVYVSNAPAVNALDESWTRVSYQELQFRLEKQRDRKSRLAVPVWDEVKSKLPAEMGVRPTSIRWSLVTFGYIPELAIPWTTMTRTHWAELPSDRILEESLFWVQTRTLNCNYCMGHCEMLLQLAGLDSSAVANRTRLLAETDWSAFPRSEQVAYAYARKLSSTPPQLTAQDYKVLEEEFGPTQAMSIFIWLCRGLYMTRISDGFQLPLERENVFGGHAPTEDKK